VTLLTSIKWPDPCPSLPWMSQIMMRARHMMSFEFNTITGSQLVGIYVDISDTWEGTNVFLLLWETKFDIHSKFKAQALRPGPEAWRPVRYPRCGMIDVSSCTARQLQATAIRLATRRLFSSEVET
jgi:hypothetical protein